MSPPETSPSPHSRLSFLFPPTDFSTMFDRSNQSPASSSTQPYAHVLALPELSEELDPALIDFTEKSQRPGLRKARKLSRVFSEFSFLDSFTLRKSVEDLRASRKRPKTAPTRSATSHGHTHKTSLGSNFNTKQSRQTFSASTLSSIVPQVNAIVPISEPETLLERSPQPPITLGTLSAPQIKPLIAPSPESIPLPPSRSSSLCCSPTIRKQGEVSTFDQLENDDSVVVCQAPHSRSLQRTPTLSLPRPKTTPNFPTSLSDLQHDTRDSSPKVARQHFAEVKRLRKMTQLFGQELPPDLIRVMDDGWKAERSRSRADSIVSSTLDSIPSTPTCESYTNLSEGENVVPTSPPTRPQVDFQERRRRVAKLSQFFGVNHAEIASSIVSTKPDHHRVASSDYSQKPVSFASGELSEVGVKVVSRRRWGLGEDMRDVELSDAINKLRCLKVN